MSNVSRKRCNRLGESLQLVQTLSTEDYSSNGQKDQVMRETSSKCELSLIHINEVLTRVSYFNEEIF